VSTFLVSFGVVVAAIAAVVHVVLNGPDQPPTIRTQPDRAKVKANAGRRRERKPPAAVSEGVAAPAVPRSPVGMPVTPAFAGPDSDIMRLRLLPVRRNSVWIRIRSGIALIVMVAVLGAMLAVAIAGLMLGLALLVRSATG
jgi:hypothetical protein